MSHILILAPPPPHHVTVTRLSDLDQSWSSLPNHFQETPATDFAFSSPFQCFTPASAVHFKHVCETYYNTPSEYSTARTSACLRGCPRLEQAVLHCKAGLESIATRLVGQKLSLHAMHYEWAHVNVQRKAQQRPVDDWHMDSMPFVLVTVLTTHDQDTGGSLVVQSPNNSTPPVRCKLRYPGESILMQGSHIRHKAEPSATGERLTLVTSFVLDSCATYDSSSIRMAVQYTPEVDCIDQYLHHAMARFARVEKGNTCSAVTVEIEKVRNAREEIAEIVGYDRKKCSNPELIAAFDRWAAVNDVLGMWLLTRKNCTTVRRDLESKM